MWGLQIHDTFTGSFRFALQPSSGRWTRRLAGAGDGSHTFLLGAVGWPLTRAQSRDVFEDTRNTLVVTWNSTAIYAGMIQRSDYSMLAGALTVKSVDIRALFRDRLLHGVDDYASGNLAITNRSNAGAVRAILQRATQWGPMWALPLVLPSDGSGSFSADWKNYQGMTIEDCLNAVEERGVEIDFNPVLTSENALEWEVRVAPKIISTQFDLPVSADKSHVKNLTLVRDASRRLTGVITFGNGTDVDMVTRYAGVPGFTIPVRDSARPVKDERTLSQLQQVANAYVAAAATPTEEWSFTVALDPVSPPQFAPGRRLNMDVRGDPWIPDAVYRKRVVALSGDLSMVITPEVQDA